jgi:hypothetical protein
MWANTDRTVCVCAETRPAWSGTRGKRSVVAAGDKTDAAHRCACVVGERDRPRGNLSPMADVNWKKVATLDGQERRYPLRCKGVSPRPKTFAPVLVTRVGLPLR